MDLLVSLSDIHLGAFNTTWAFVVDQDSPALSRLSRRAPDWGVIEGTPGRVLWKELDRSILFQMEILLRQNYVSSTDDIRPVLVLNGDILDLSLAPTAFACLNARCFFHCMEESGFKEVIYVPGNHDHHLWRIALEEAALREAVDQGKSHYNRTAAVPGVSEALRQLFGLSDGIKLTVAYPNYLHVVSGNLAHSERQWWLVFHHGHLLERWWTALSTLIPSNDGRSHSLEELEAINEPLTELLWFATGDAGRLSDIVGSLYVGAVNSEQMKTLLDNVVKEAFQSLQRRWGLRIPGWKQWLIRGAIVEVMSRLATSGLAGGGDKVSRVNIVSSNLRGSALNEQLRVSVAGYRSRYASVSPSCFIFGHTHKTQADDSIIVRDFTTIDIGKTGFHECIFNTGGWVVEPTVAKPDASYLISMGRLVKLEKVTIPEMVLEAARANADLT